MGAALFGYTSLYGRCPADRPVPADSRRPTTARSRCPRRPADDRFLFLSDVLPTAWQAVAVRPDPRRRQPRRHRPGTDRRRWPAGSLSTSARARSSGVDLVPERLARSQSHGVADHRRDGDRRRPRRRASSSPAAADPTRYRRGRHGGPRARAPAGNSSPGAQPTGLLPDPIARKITDPAARRPAQRAARRGQGRAPRRDRLGQRRLRREVDPHADDGDVRPRRQLRMGQAHVRRWIDDLLPIVATTDPLGVHTFATHHLPLDEAPHGYEIFRDKADGCIKVVLQP